MREGESTSMDNNHYGQDTSFNHLKVRTEYLSFSHSPHSTFLLCNGPANHHDQTRLATSILYFSLLVYAARQLHWTGCRPPCYTLPLGMIEEVSIACSIIQTSCHEVTTAPSLDFLTGLIAWPSFLNIDLITIRMTEHRRPRLSQSSLADLVPEYFQRTTKYHQAFGMPISSPT